MIDCFSFFIKRKLSFWENRIFLFLRYSKKNIVLICWGKWILLAEGIYFSFCVNNYKDFYFLADDCIVRYISVA